MFIPHPCWSKNNPSFLSAFGGFFCIGILNTPALCPFVPLVIRFTKRQPQHSCSTCSNQHQSRFCLSKGFNSGRVYELTWNNLQTLSVPSSPSFWQDVQALFHDISRIKISTSASLQHLLILTAESFAQPKVQWRGSLWINLQQFRKQSRPHHPRFLSTLSVACVTKDNINLSIAAAPGQINFGAVYTAKNHWWESWAVDLLETILSS